jgi:DNA-binding CsgD family transcriptional regulator/tetratricopeptide (TPR) repeat protein
LNGTPSYHHGALVLSGGRRVGETVRVPVRGTIPRFVGRESEFGLLRDLLGQSGSHAPTTAVVYGEAGVGKTRLVTELVARARAEGVRTLVGGCASVGGRALPFAPFAEALRPLSGETSVAGAETAGRPGGLFVSSFLALLSSELSEGRGETAAPAGGVPAVGLAGRVTQTRLFEDVVDELERLATPGGALLVVEDVHWADPSSRSLFDFIARNLRDAPVTLVATARNDEPPDPELSGWLAELQRGAGAVRVDLAPFTRPEVADLVEAVLGEAPAAGVADRVFERSGGNAFLAQELLAGDDAGEVPQTVRDLLVSRVTRLSVPARRVFGLAAAAGLEVSHDVLAAASGLDPDTFEATVRELIDQRLLVVTAYRPAYAFRHALTREAAYGDLLPGERRRLHAALAGVLDPGDGKGTAPGVARAATIAEHWDAAGQVDRALRAHVRAGQAAEDVFAHADALGHFERALELWDLVDDSASIAGIDHPGLLASAAEVASAIGEDDLGIDHVSAAIAEAGASGESQTRIGLLHLRLATYLGRAGRDDDTEEALRRAVALVPSEPPSAARAEALARLATELMAASRYLEALPSAEAALEVAVRVGARKLEANARVAIGSSLFSTGQDIDRGIDELHQALAIGKEIDDVHEVARGAGNLSDCMIRLGRFDDAARIALEGAEAGRQGGAARGDVGFVTLNASEAWISAGRWDEAEDLIGRALELGAGVYVEVTARAQNALVHIHRGRVDAAATELAHVDRMGQGINQAQLVAMIDTGRALVALARNDLDAARQAMAHVLDVFDRTDEQGPLVALAALGARIEAERATLGRARRDDRLRRDASTRARAVVDRARRAVPDDPSPPVAANLALCEAELTRAEGRSEPERWLKAAETFSAAGMPFPAAYSRLREAEAALAGGDRGRAAAALNAAHRGATELGAMSLSSEVEAIARRARITLAPTVPAGTEGGSGGSETPEPEPPPFGLTSRELEVLRLVAAGHTNPQIAAELYISHKTASHHVSNILTKLGVATRVQAAGIAHDLGLDRVAG